MSKRAGQAVGKIHNRALLEAEKYATSHAGSIIEEVAFGRGFKAGFIEGYEQAEKDFIDLVKQYIERGERCMEQEGESQIYAFWDGFHNCAENILRELEVEHESD